MNIQDNSRYHQVHARSLADPEGFGERRRATSTGSSPRKRSSIPPWDLTGRWFAGAVGQHLLQRARPSCCRRTRRSGGADPRFAFAGRVTRLTYAEMLAEVKTLAAIMQDFGVARGRPRHPLYADGAGSRDRDAGLRADRRGAFGGVRRFCRKGTRNADRRCKTEADLLGKLRLEPGRIVQYKPLLEEAIKLSSVKPEACIILQRPQQSCDLGAGRDHDWAELRAKAFAAKKIRRLRAGSRDRSALYPLHPQAPPGSPRAWCATMAGIWSR